MRKNLAYKDEIFWQCMTFEKKERAGIGFAKIACKQQDKGMSKITL